MPEPRVALQSTMANTLVSLKTNNNKTEFPNTEAMESGEKSGREQRVGIPRDKSLFLSIAKQFVSAYVLGFNWIL